MTLELNEKQTYAFLNGICKKNFHTDVSITAEYLQSNIFPDAVITLEEVEAVMSVYLSYLRHAAKNCFNTSAFIAYLGEQGITNDATLAAFSRIWKSEEAKIHAQLVSESINTTTMDNVSWRIDVLSNKQQNEEGADTAIALMNLQTTLVDGGKSSMLLELDKNELQQLLKQMDVINDCINKHV